jgi:hypothetical protein
LLNRYSLQKSEQSNRNEITTTKTTALESAAALLTDDHGLQLLILDAKNVYAAAATGRVTG